MTELWCGAECTINRVRDRWFDQIARTGHDSRLDDVDRMASLGVKAVRFAISWEREGWAYADARMARFRELGLRVIVGLVHHGSGPAETSLLDEGFVDGLAEHARKVAERYPWVVDYTPINEPLTTSRFSALYGHWFPHAKDARSFARALLIQTRATSAAMRAIRSIVPGARLIQTEDMGRIYGTEPLAYQVEFENHRRWTSLDLLFGRLDRTHRLYRYYLAQGAPERWLEELADAPCPPDIIGANYYVTSDRFLDHRLDKYPAWTHGGNERHGYADVEAVRVREEGIHGHAAMLEETFARYGVPVAITEAHLGCSEDEQVMWLAEAWAGARAAEARGVIVPGVTVWSVFGAYDWDSLLTIPQGHYEPGAFDVRAAGAPRETELARTARALAGGAEPEKGRGWWRRDARLIYADAGRRIA